MTDRLRFAVFRRAGPAGDLLRCNARICTGLGPWLIVVPTAATMLVLFALMAMTSLVGNATPVLVLEMLGSVLMAFVGVNLLRPEHQYHTLETVLTRPMSFRVILLVRVLLGALAVLALQALLGLYMRAVMNKPFHLGWAILAAAVSMAFLTALALAVAAAWRSPTFGFVAAAAFWALDLALGPRLNPLFTLRGYSAYLDTPNSEFNPWASVKVGLALLAVGLSVLAARAAVRPVAQRSARRYVRTGVAVLVGVLAYLCTGVVYQVKWGEAHEAELLNRSRLWYQTALVPYGPLPVAYLLGPAFARFVGYRAPGADLASTPGGVPPSRRDYDRQQLSTAAFGYPGSRWADNALYELGRRMLEGDNETASADEARLGLKCLEELVAEHPASPFAPPALERLAGAYERLGRLQDSRGAVDRLLGVYPTSPFATKAGKALLTKLADPAAPGGPRLPEAVAVADKLVRAAGPDDRPELLLQRGLILADATVGRAAEAQTVLQQAADEGTARAREAMAAMSEPDVEVLQRVRGLNDVSRRAKAELQKLAGPRRPGGGR